jgi:hypothetical protein
VAAVLLSLFLMRLSGISTEAAVAGAVRPLAVPLGASTPTHRAFAPSRLRADGDAAALPRSKTAAAGVMRPA